MSAMRYNPRIYRFGHERHPAVSSYYYSPPATWVLKDDSEDEEKQSKSQAEDSADENATERLSRPFSQDTCARCSRLDFDKIFLDNGAAWKAQNWYSETLEYLRNWHEHSTESCPLCALLLSVVGIESPRPPTIYRSPWIHINNRVYRGGLYQMPRPPFMVSSEAEGMEYLRLLPERLADYESVSKWLEFCHANHVECNKRTVSINVAGLRLIDCETRAIVAALNHRYVTLSYVWGQQPDNSKHNSEHNSEPNAFIKVLPSDLPATIEDSIIVTKALGYRYLWIDRYCLDKRDERHFAGQLQQMGVIYKNSALTIVAASGENDTYGLPGVRHRGRKPQATARVGKHLLVSSMSDPVDLVQASKWSSRGWTYQEGSLSTRRLFFTDEQMYYECQGGFYSEVLKYDLQELHDENHFGTWKGGFGMSMLSRDLTDDGTWRTTLASVWTRISEYTRREFTDFRDVPDAFLGVMSAFESMDPPYRHLFGLPVPPSPPDSLYQHPLRVPFDVSESYRLPTEAGFVGAMCWELEKPALRRVDFPSWSWMGWHGQVDHPETGRSLGLGSLGHYYMHRDVTIGIELQQGRVLTWSEFTERYDEPGARPQLSPHIHITAWISPLTIISQNQGKALARMDLTDGKYMHWSFSLTSSIALPEQGVYLGVWMWLGEKKWVQRLDATGPQMLVIAVSEDGSAAERIGFGGIWQSCCTFFDKEGNKQNTISGPALFVAPDQPERKNWMNGVWLEGPDMFPKERRSIRLG